MSNPNCFTCKHRRDIQGNAHSRCGHPSLAAFENNPLAEMVSLMGGTGPIPNPPFRVVGNYHGIRMGWFAWPFNFDPNWLEECAGYENSSNVVRFDKVAEAK